MDIQQSLNTLQESGAHVKIQWRPGHANIQGNEIAGRLAKEAAKRWKKWQMMQELQPSLMLDQQQENLLKSNGKGGGKYLKKEKTCSCTDQQLN